MTSPTSTPASTSDPADRDGGEISYADAQAELDAILHELDGDEVDVDVLGARVRRAAELLRLCRDRIAAARFEVEQVVGELEAEAEAAAVDDVDIATETDAAETDLDLDVDEVDEDLDDGDDPDRDVAGWADDEG